jgi:hypothetical protein
MYSSHENEQEQIRSITERVRWWLEADASELASTQFTDIHIDQLLAIDGRDLTNLGRNAIVTITVRAYLALIRNMGVLGKEYQPLMRMRLVSRADNITCSPPANIEELVAALEVNYPPTLELLSWTSYSRMPDRDEEYLRRLPFNIINEYGFYHEYAEIRWPDESIGRQITVAYYPTDHA